MNENIFKALSSKTRVQILKLLMHREYHVSGLAKALDISVPVTARHVKILEAAGLVETTEYGKTHVLNMNMAKLYEALETFSEAYEIEVEQGTSILEALKQVAGVGIKQIGAKEFIASIDDEEGFYVYEVNGKLPDKPINKYRINRSEEIEIRRLVPVLKKRVRVNVKEGKKRK